MSALIYVQALAAYGLSIDSATRETRRSLPDRTFNMSIHCHRSMVALRRFLVHLCMSLCLISGRNIYNQFGSTIMVLQAPTDCC
jgi:hypothetical protein